MTHLWSDKAQIAKRILAVGWLGALAFAIWYFAPQGALIVWLILVGVLAILFATTYAFEVISDWVQQDSNNKGKK